MLKKKNNDDRTNIIFQNQEEGDRVANEIIFKILLAYPAFALSKQLIFMDFYKFITNNQIIIPKQKYSSKF